MIKKVKYSQYFWTDEQIVAEMRRRQEFARTDPKYQRTEAQLERERKALSKNS